MAIERYFAGKEQWALILGGSSGFGLATARKLAAEGMHLVILHRDRKKEMARIEAELEEMRAHGVRVLAFNADALREEVRAEVLQEIKTAMGERGRVRLLLHAIAKGNLKPMTEKTGAPEGLFPDSSDENNDLDRLYRELHARRQADLNFPFAPLQNRDLELTVQAMAFSLYDWVQAVHGAGLFAADARIIGLTSEGNSRAWRYYAAVSAAKAALEAICRSIALEFAPYGLRCNVVQPGVTDTPSLRMIPGSEHLKRSTILRNPFHRLTRPEDVANAIYLLCRDEAAWINGAVIPVDGGERNS
jgi:enoyl-[acyl-carrier protein] reductase I